MARRHDSRGGQGKPGADLAIGIRQSIPFADFDRHGAPRGLAVDIWNKLATTLETRDERDLVGKREFVDLPAIDMAASPLTITSECMESYHFSHSARG